MGLKYKKKEKKKGVSLVIAPITDGRKGGACLQFKWTKLNPGQGSGHSKRVLGFRKKMGLAGMEVPIIGSDSVNWVELFVSPSSSTSTSTSTSPPFAPLTVEDYSSSCSIIQHQHDSPTYLIWLVFFLSLSFSFSFSLNCYSNRLNHSLQQENSQNPSSFPWIATAFFFYQCGLSFRRSSIHFPRCALSLRFCLCLPKSDYSLCFDHLGTRLPLKTHQQHFHL